MIKQYAAWVIRWRYLIIISSIIVVGLLGSGGQHLGFSNDYRIFFGKTNPQLEAFENLQDTYTKNDNLLYMLEPKDGKVFTPETLQAIIELTEATWQLPYSIRVDSLSNFQHTRAQGDDLTVQDLFNTSDLTKEQLEEIKQISINEPLLVNRLISPSAHVTGINVTIQLPGKRATEELPEVVKPAREILQDFQNRYPDINFYLTGIVMMNNAFPEASQTDMQTLVPLAFIAIILGLLIATRSFAGTIATVIVIIMSIMAAMGTTGWLGIKLTPPSATAPTMILTLAVADCVHILITFLQGMRRGLDKNAAIIESIRINFHPIFLTSLTTILGFLSLNFSDVPPFHDLGNITSMGVCYAFILSILFFPALLSFLPIIVKQERDAQDTIMGKLAELVIRKRHSFLIGSSLLIVLTIAFIPQNELNDIFVNYFDESIEFRRHTDHITSNLTGMYYIDYSLNGETASAVSKPEFQKQVQKFADWYEQQPEVLHVNSYTSIMKRLNKNMHGDDPSMYKLPEQQDLAAQYLLLYEMSLPYGLDLNNQINLDKSATRITVLLQTLSSNELIALEKRAKDWIAANTPELQAFGASPGLMFAHIGQRNIISMLFGVTLALILISLTLMIALRSFKYGFISLLPNLLPAGVSFGLWGLFVGEVGLGLSVVAGMTLGIVVDDTVHFLSKYLRARREQNLNSHDAVRYAFSSVGVALLVTTIVLAAGFLVLSMSAFELNSGMGLLTAITISIALIIDFFFLPPLLMKIEEPSK